MGKRRLSAKGPHRANAGAVGPSFSSQTAGKKIAAATEVATADCGAVAPGTSQHDGWYGFQVCTQNQIEAQPGGFGLEGRRDKMGESNGMKSSR